MLALVTTSASVAHADRLIDTRQIARGDYLAPQFSPDGGDLLLTGPQLRGLYLATLTGRIAQLTDDAEAGVHARWQRDGSIAYRAPRAGYCRSRPAPGAAAQVLVWLQSCELGTWCPERDAVVAVRRPVYQENR